ncbi:MAG: RpiB/LacA/LacB family sugar-phosphate isomerase [Verrucomicrobiales bacterium]
MKRDLTCQLQLALQTSNVVGIASDHGGHELKEYLAQRLREAGAEVIDFGDHQLVADDDYPDFVVPLAHAVAAGRVGRGVAICGSGVGACVVANKVRGVRACLIHDHFSAHQGVEDDDLNLICLGGQVVGHALAWELLLTFLAAQFSGKERHRRRLGKVTELENHPAPRNLQTTDGVPFNPSRSPKLYLIRHGETEWALSGRHTGLTDISLTAAGEDEVKEWAQCLTDFPFDHVLTSPLIRARRTCELVGLAEFAKVESDLVEWDYGDYEGLSSVDICKERPGWNVFRDGCPNGELPAQVSARADRLIAQLRTMEGNVALFGHGHFGAVLIARWIGLAIDQSEHFRLATAGLSVLSTDPHHPEVPIVELLNATPHGAFLPGIVDIGTPAEKRAIQRWENEGGELLDPSEVQNLAPST